MVVQSNRSLAAFYVPKVVIVGLLWVTGLCLAFWDRVHQVTDPGFVDVDPGVFEVIKGFYIVLGVAYVLYLLYLLTRAYAELSNLPYFGDPFIGPASTSASLPSSFQTCA